VHENGQQGQARQLEGVGFLAHYGSGQFTVTWADGSNLTLNLASTSLSTAAGGQDQDGIVWLRVQARLPGPPDVRDELTVVLPFQAGQSGEVRRLAAELREQAGPRPPTAPASAEVPKRGPDQAKGQPDGLAPIRIGVEPGLWANDPHWLGLCPPTETRRLLTQRGQD
jgi:hypothetical protein